MTFSPRATLSTRIGLLTGAAGAVLMAGAAYAESRPVTQTTVSASPGYAAAQAAAHPTPPPADDGLTGGGFYPEADELTQDDTNQLVTAKGGVEARYKGRVLRAEELDYNRDSGVVTARGKVQILNQDGTAQFADAITLDKDMTEGVAIGFSTRLQGNVKIAAASAMRQGEENTELRNAIYTPCEVCAENGRQQPTWSIRARKVIQNRKKHIVYYQDAVIQVFGVGVLYLPAFWTADPEVDRKSGLLPPLVTFSQKRGATYEQPYYQVIGKSQDLLITPQLNTKVNPFLNLQWRRRFYSGGIDVRAGYTYERDFDSHGDRLGELTSRSYILAGGAFDIDDHWRWGFTGERASDDLIFDKYDIGDVFRERGLYATDDRRLISQFLPVNRRHQRPGPAPRRQRSDLPNHRAADRGPLRTPKRHSRRAASPSGQRRDPRSRPRAGQSPPPGRRQPSRHPSGRLAHLVHPVQRPPYRAVPAGARRCLQPARPPAAGAQQHNYPAWLRHGGLRP